MKISSRVDYALSCLLVIAAQDESERPTSVKYIAEQEKIEVDYVEQLLIVMKRAGILKSLRGVKGGYLLARPAGEITAFDIVRSFEGEVLELVCFRAKGRRSTCIHLADCEVRSFWTGLRGHIQEYLEQTTVTDLLALRQKEKMKG